MSVKRLRDFLKGTEIDPNNVHWSEEPAAGTSSHSPSHVYR